MALLEESVIRTKHKCHPGSEMVTVRVALTQNHYSNTYCIQGRVSFIYIVFMKVVIFDYEKESNTTIKNIKEQNKICD